MDRAWETDPPDVSPARSVGTLEVRPLADRAGWQAAGEISLTTRSAWEQALCRMAQDDGEVYHLELSAVTFVDVAGVSALAAAARSLPEGRRIMLEQPPAAVGRVLDMFWPGLRGVEVVSR
ncbi:MULTISPECIES: STAS domain-containing protein [Streptomyces]|uniref:STAS domain-containing protein n=1 Tax=Streptomyces TaxID=1883 RepID=UPI001F3FEE64|nr:STAS domain-containing protein [Streptomyces apricus]